MLGVVVDVAFPGELPEIYHALKIQVPEGDGRRPIDLVLRSSSTSATTASRRWPWTRPTGWSAATP